MTQLSVRKITPTSVLPFGKVVKRDALSIVAPARNLIEEIEAHGHEVARDAFERGKAEGEAEGREAGAALLAEATLAVRSHLQKSQRRLAEIVVQAIHRVVGQLEIDELVAGMVGKLVAEAQDEERISLRVAPAHYDKVRRLVDGLANQGDVESVDVVSDPALGKGACRMETAAGSLETSIDAQIEKLRAAIEKHS
ncbi:MAG: FliH/SctL family protein [Gammaproteobacteria bacterium]|nr:FliH/SctL family protein [Gammaproteobacteria bacterium]MDE0273938.1 FliH/SctL family protein [Gammaproteobacteria bacterium]